MDFKNIAHDVAVESEMSHESLSALTAVIQEGIDRALAAAALSAGEPDGMETNAEERAKLLQLERHATPGPWEHDNTQCKPEQTAYETMYDSGGEKAESLFGSENSGAAVIHAEYDEGTYYWDETAKNNFAFIAAARSALPRLLRDFDRLLAREAKARETERTECVEAVKKVLVRNPHHDGARHLAIDAIRARTAPDLQSGIGLRAHLADLAARGLKP